MMSDLGSSYSAIERIGELPIGLVRSIRAGRVPSLTRSFMDEETIRPWTR